MPWLAENIKCRVCGGYHNFYGQEADSSMSAEYEMVCPATGKKGTLHLITASRTVKCCPDGAVLVSPVKRT